MRFNALPISDGSKDAIAAMGYEEATPIQELAIPPLLEGKDVIGRARTGTGKTAAFGIPLVEDIQSKGNGVHALVLVPTRELANQVTEVLRELAKASRIRVVPIYGGVGFGGQIAGVRQKAPLVVVACPGRLLDLHNRGDVDLSGVSFLVLDEADRMLDMGFVHDMRKIAKLLPSERQTSLFSATLDNRVRGIAKDFVWKDALTVEVPGSDSATPLTEQFQVHVEKPAKLDTLLSLLHHEQPERGIVFTKMKHQAKRVADKLNHSGWSSVALQGNMSQAQRDRAMAAFRDGKARLLVATDVAARGIDVPDITHIINHDLPMEDEAYVHRIGRTGRNGREGRSFTFVQSDERRKFSGIERLAGSSVPRHDVPRADAKGPDAPLRLAAPPHQGGGGRGRRPRGPGRSGGQYRQGGGSGRRQGGSGSGHRSGGGRRSYGGPRR